MMSRALKAFPGMVFSVLLASPALAASQLGHHPRQDEPSPPRRSLHANETRHADDTRRPASARPALASLSRAGGRVTAATRGRRGGRGTMVTASVRERPFEDRAYDDQAYNDRRPDARAEDGRAYLNDATAWSSTGSAVTAGGMNAGPHGYGYGAGRGDAVSGRVMQVGMASWYGGRQWQGRRMSSGDRFDDAQLTAAHATLPLGSKVLVALAGGGRSVVVTITDRPGTRKRIIDLSRAAAAELGILDRGLAQVALTPL